MNNHHLTSPSISSCAIGNIPRNDTETFEVTNNMSTVQVSQTQNTDHCSSLSTYPTSNTTETAFELPLNSSNNPTVSHTPPGLVRLYHEHTSKYVLQQYCLPVVDTFISTEGICKFNKQCIVSKTKLINDGENIRTLSPTVYKKSVFSSRKSLYSRMDTRLVQCFNKICKSSNVKLSKCFHFICYEHMMKIQTDPRMDVLELVSKKENVLHHVIEGIDMEKISNSIKLDHTKLIFPVCGKRCYNTLMKTKKNNSKDGVSDYTVAQSWDKDGNVNTNTMSSIDILIDWLTTEENASKYFGGVDMDGNTNATRKEAYHHHIRDLIKKENGSDRSSESVRTKIIRIMQSYKEASERMLRTGNGLTGFQHTSFQEYIVKDICKYYFLLDPVLKDRPNVSPWFTNEEESSSNESTKQKTKKNTIYLSSDDDSTDSVTDMREDENTLDTFNISNNLTRSDFNGNERTEYDSTSSDLLTKSVSSNIISSANTSFLSDDNTGKNEEPRIRPKRNVSSSSSVSPKKKTKKHTSNKYTPSEAKKLQKNVIKNKKRTIAKNKGKLGFSNIEKLEKEELELNMEIRNKKMTFENKRHMDMKFIEERKIDMERERLDMEKDTIRLKHENLQLQNNSERSKLVLLRLEMFKQRQEIKKSDPEITDDYLE